MKIMVEYVMTNGEHVSYKVESSGSPKFLTLLTYQAQQKVRRKEVITGGIWVEQPDEKHYALHTLVTKGE